jgi:hypothetical protein
MPQSSRRLVQFNAGDRCELTKGGFAIVIEHVKRGWYLVEREDGMREELGDGQMWFAPSEEVIYGTLTDEARRVVKPKRPNAIGHVAREPLMIPEWIGSSACGIY